MEESERRRSEVALSERELPFTVDICRQGERGRQTHMDSWRLREGLTEGSERENEGKETDRCTDKQTGGVGGEGVRQP